MAFDSEWYEDTQEIYCWCSVDSACNKVKLHIKDYQGESDPKYSFLKAVVQTFKNYHYHSDNCKGLFLGFSVLNGSEGFESDLAVMEKNITTYSDLVNDWNALMDKICLVDVFKIFHNNAIEGFLKGVGIKYRSTR